MGKQVDVAAGRNALEKVDRLDVAARVNGKRRDPRSSFLDTT
jgi:hypothetical protein